eukprot:CAMPEP_0176256110 /NCGR_PEP_ID=MMETSP0121_2-20121125/37377_1 /TAXON_ID=160619 /ORGANISM="Kryptoperidinium foliaceum, Strain CCMP 1326" /LENGTH=326 /DNA_ID=CAMNT_0017595937 /DNA_START=35 /DNA_END=1015 /DNA_ORIENTATION=+
MAYPGSDAKNGLPLAPSNGSSDGASVTLTPEELKAYHAVVQKLSAIQNMRQAVDSAGANVYWDFKAQHARPGRIWQDHVPDEWRSELERDYTPEEMQAARDLTGIDKATPVPDDVRPRCVFLLGPPGAGKSTCLPRAAVVLNVTLDNSVTIDGDDLRSCHAAWVKRIDSDPVNGYSDSFQVFKKAQRRWRGEFDTLKIQLTTEAQKQRKNVIICDTKANKQVLENFRSMNYEVIVIGLLISQKESDARNRNRGQEIGRFGDASPKAWHVCMDALKWLTQPEHSDRVVVFDTTDLSNPKVVFSRTHDRSAMEQALDRYAAEIETGKP